jgi:hypothetical protein
MYALLPKTDNIFVCWYCGLHHTQVEASGVYYCPNPLCSGPGGAWFRATLESYKEEGNRHSVDPVEWLEKGLAVTVADQIIWDARRASQLDFPHTWTTQNWIARKRRQLWLRRLRHRLKPGRRLRDRLRAAWAALVR